MIVLGELPDDCREGFILKVWHQLRLITATNPSVSLEAMLLNLQIQHDD